MHSLRLGVEEDGDLVGGEIGLRGSAGCHGGGVVTAGLDFADEGIGEAGKFRGGVAHDKDRLLAGIPRLFGAAGLVCPARVTGDHQFVGGEQRGNFADLFRER